MKEIESKETESNVLAFPEADVYMEVTQLAARHHTTPAVTYQDIANGKYPANVVLRLGRKILIHRKNLEAFEANGGTAQPEEKRKAA